MKESAAFSQKIESEDIGAAFDATLADESRHEKDERLARYTEQFQKYLNPPYRFDLPEKMLTFGDADYDHYLCRPNVYQPALGAMDAIVHDGVLGLTAEESREFERWVETIQHFPHGVKRTLEEMEILRTAMEGVVEILKRHGHDLRASAEAAEKRSINIGGVG